MAIMCPETPREYTPNSREGEMFSCLADLPDEYYVFHSLSIARVSQNTLFENEIDFVVFHPRKGILCIEAKAGRVQCGDGQWMYADGTAMSHGGPYRQASANKWRIKNCFEDKDLGHLLKKCKLLHAVWFPSVSKEYLRSIDLPTEANIHLALTSDSFENIEGEIAGIFEISLPIPVTTNLNENEEKTIIDRILAPSFNLVTISEIQRNYRKHVFKSLLKEQIALLNYLEEQRTAIISGIAGTGKTVMAVEKAKRHAEKGEHVLFLCYNKFLKDYLRKEYAHPNISYYTIDGLACFLCDTGEPNYAYLEEVLIEMSIEKRFPFQHVIIDEGQDFGKTAIEECEIIEYLKANVVEVEESTGSFYLFYDKNQMIQSSQIPSYISDAECKLTLYRNCRNTKNIALSSLRLLGNKKSLPILNDGTVAGDSPELFVVGSKEQTLQVIDTIVQQNHQEGYLDIQILTCRTEETSVVFSECNRGMYLGRASIPFTTCRKFKGLEADIIILIDIDNNMFDKNYEQILYVGASRARHRLYMIANLTDEECVMLLRKKDVMKARRPKKELASLINAKYKKT